MKNKIFHKRLPDFQTLDRVEIEIVPRYKTSGVSGDEWRQSVAVRGYFKGIEVFSFDCGRHVEYGFALLPGEYLRWGDSGIGDKILEREKACCDQPTCEEPWTVRRMLKRLTSSSGQYLDPADQSFRYYRKFCKKHSKRGDCSREDSDDNYEPMEQ